MLLIDDSFQEIEDRCKDKINDQELPLGVKREPDGSFTMSGIAARVGVQEYPFGSVLRTEDVLREATPRLIGVPVTIEHPSDGKVTRLNESQVSRGEIIDAQFEEEQGVVLVRLRTDARGLRAIRDGKNQLSVGQEVDLIPDAGIWVDRKGVAGLADNTYEHDSRFDDIRPNHVALTDSPRAGDVAALFIANETKQENDDMNTENLSTLQTMITALQAGLKNLENNFKEAVNATDSKVLEISKELLDVKNETKAVLDSINSKLETPPVIDSVEEIKEEVPELSVDELVSKEIKARAEVLKQINDSSDELITMSSKQLKEKFITDSVPDLDLSTYSDDQLQAMFDVLAIANNQEQKQSSDNTNRTTTPLTAALDSTSVTPQKVSADMRLASARVERSKKRRSIA